MANYNYDEGGNLAAYFLITVLAIILIPTTLSLSTSKKKKLSGCQCTPCVERRASNSKREQGSLLRPKLSNKSIFLLVGWSIMGLLCYKVAGSKSDSKVYDPFEILGLRSSASEKEIKKHYRKLALKFHPDKVKLAVNETIEAASNYYVELTKAYKSLTDPEVRENLRKWGHPDGRQETSAGIALPKWVIEGKNNKWVLGVYALLFGGALPVIVGRWWFGSRQKTKDGISARSASTFFKSLKEDSSITDIIAILVKAYEHETLTGKFPSVGDIGKLEEAITKKLGSTNWRPTKLDEKSRVALALLYAHMLRLDVASLSLANVQAEILLQTPVLLNAMFNISTARNWLSATLSILRFSQYLTQAVSPGAVDNRWAQLPGVSEEQSKEFKSSEMEEVLARLHGKEDAQHAAKSLGKVDLVDAAYKVIGERVVVPASIVYLVVKLRLQSPTGAKPEPELSVDETKRRIKVNDAKDIAFLESRDEAERLSDLTAPGYIHAPHWPGNRRPTWWLILADDKSNRIVVPPAKITEIPHANSDHSDGRDYRSYKMQFQAPQGTGLFTWKIYIVSDAFIGEDLKRDISLKIDDVSALDVSDEVEDEISDPDEDTLAGQMAMMKGGKVKKAAVEEESDDESDTDGDNGNDSDSSSDSD